MTTSRIPPAPPRERGRPRAFDTDTALDNAMIVFRQKGFHASSVADLSEAMNLTAGSIYKAFKDKRTLFLRVFERYISVRGADLRALQQEKERAEGVRVAAYAGRARDPCAAGVARRQGARTRRARPA